MSGVSQVVVVAPATHLRQARDLVAPGETVAIVPGGRERSESVSLGLAQLHPEVEFVLVHDAARCLAPPVVFERVVEALRAGAVAVVPGLAVTDTIKQVDATGTVLATPDRASLRAVQTPQGFAVDVLHRAHAGGGVATDDAALVEALGLPVLVVDGDVRAAKITTPADLEHAERTLDRSEPPRPGGEPERLERRPGRSEQPEQSEQPGQADRADRAEATITTPDIREDPR